MRYNHNQILRYDSNSPRTKHVNLPTYPSVLSSLGVKVSARSQNRMPTNLVKHFLCYPQHPHFLLDPLYANLVKFIQKKRP